MIDVRHPAVARSGDLALGIGIACAIGLTGVIVYLIVRRHDGQLHGPATLGAPVDVVRMPALPPSKATGRGVSYASVMKTYTLRNDRAARLFTGVGVRHWKVEVNAVGPPGTFAHVGTDPSSLLVDGAWGVMLIAAGQRVPIRLRPDDVLYARGSVNGVTVSIAASEDDD